MGIGCSRRGLWCALAGLYGARYGRWAGSGLSELAPSCTSTYLSIPEVPTPFGLLSPMRGIAVSWYEFPRYLWEALVAREAHGRLPLFHHRHYRIPTSFPLDT